MKMIKDWSKHWKGSVQPRKQRKYVYNAPLHIIRNLFSVTLSKELRKKHGKRNISLRTGDKVKIMRGQFKGKVTKVEKLSFVRRRVFLEDVALVKKDGNKVAYNVSPSNLMILELNMDDKMRKKYFERK